MKSENILYMLGCAVVILNIGVVLFVLGRIFNHFPKF